MAFKKNTLPSQVVEFVSQYDPAIDWDSVDEEFKEEFIKTRDKGLLKFKDDEEPTIFLLKPKLSMKIRAELQNKTIKTGKGGLETEVGSYIYESLKRIIVGITNPSNVPTVEALLFKKDNLGLCSEQTLQDIYDADERVLDEILAFVNRQKESDIEELKNG